MALETLVYDLKDLAMASGMLAGMSFTFYGVCHVTYKVYTEKVLNKIITNYEKEKKNNKDF